MTTPTGDWKKSLLKTLLPVVVILGLVIGGLFLVKLQVGKSPPPGSAEIAERASDTLPDFSLQGLDGSSVPVSSFKSRIVMLNFWASWCEACMVEMPSIIRLRNEFASKGFEVLAVNVDENPKAVVPRLIEQLKIPFPIYVDPEGKLAETFEVSAIPLTVIMDRNRKILFTENGGRDWNAEEIRSKLTQWLAQ